MKGVHWVFAILCSFALLGGVVRAQDDESENSILVSVADQKLMVVRDGMWVARYPVSTSKFGIGDAFGSYKTPLGRLRVCQKIGSGLPQGAVLQHRNATGEILPVNARGRDPIVTRIIWLEGLEAANEHARARGIYIHGTVEESKIGKPASYGCIRMRSDDVKDLFEMIPVGTQVMIQTASLPRLKRWSPPPPPPMIVAKPKPEEKPIAAVEKKPAPVAEKKTLAENKPAPMVVSSKVSPASAEAGKIASAASKAGSSVPEKPDPQTANREKPRLVTAAARPSDIDNVKPVTFASESGVKPRATVVIRSSGWAEDKMVPADPGAAEALKSSILFADLPGTVHHQ